MKNRKIHLTFILAVFIVAACIGQSELIGGNIIINGEFDTYPSYWSGWIDTQNVIATLSKDTNSVLSGKNSLLLDITEGGSDYWGIQRIQNAWLETDYDYTIGFMGIKEGGPDSVAIHMLFEINADPYTKYIDQTYYLHDEPKHFGPYLFVPVEDDYTNQFKLFFGGTDNVKIWVDSVVVLKRGPIWRNVEIEPISEDRTVEWRMTPSHSPMDGIVGLAEGEVSYLEDLCCVVRFNTEGYIDVSNGEDFEVDNTVYYEAGQRYDVKASVNMVNLTYSVTVKPQGDEETVIATDYDFQVGGNPIDHLVINVETDPDFGGVDDSHIDVTGIDVTTSVDDEKRQTVPMTFRLDQNYPNPFNPCTTIRFYLSEQSAVSLQIYNLMGQLVKDFGLKEFGTGEQVVFWDATDSQGKSVPSGVYYYRIKTEQHSAIRKMILLK